MISDTDISIMSAILRAPFCTRVSFKADPRGFHCTIEGPEITAFGVGSFPVDAVEKATIHYGQIAKHTRATVEALAKKIEAERRRKKK